MFEETLDTFICVHRRDIDYLFEISLRSYLLNFIPKRRLVLITNDLVRLKHFVERFELGGQITLSSDEDWLSKRELTLRGWYRQQIIKLRSYEFCETDNFCSLGADTILLRKIFYHDLVKDTYPFLFHTQHNVGSPDFLWEQSRCDHVAELLQVQRSFLSSVDFINDLFCFNKEDLISLNKYLQNLHGPNCFYRLLCQLGDKEGNQKFGEWTLYAVYLLEYLKRDVTLRNLGEGFLRQVHDLEDLPNYKFDSKVVHFVNKAFSVEAIKEGIRFHNLELGKYLL